ncbi:DUF3558 domain-containing protein [Kibdelosporangium philippinense]|uniref:DUF3558 domain-containing protein n=1 Tax=Kibdelosporangium philippinense TaxID=211113 RepID=UPI003556E765
MGVVACNAETAGTPTASLNTPAARPTVPGESKSGTTTTSRPDTGSNLLEGIDPCSLLSASERAQVGVAEGQPRDTVLDTTRSCEFVASGEFNLRVNTFGARGIKDVVANRGEIKPTPKVGRHDAVQSFGGINSCAITIAISDTSRVDSVAAHNREGDAKSCEIALQVVRLIEPKLPGGN